MILNQKQTTLAYRCPSCGGVVTSMVGAFSLSGNMFRLKCSCGGSHMTVEKTNDGKMRLIVPCLVCANTHSYIISNEVFFDSDVFVIGCSMSGVDICFIGKEKPVEDAIIRSNEEIIEMVGGGDLASIRNEEKDHFALSDPQIVDIVKYVINELQDEGKIYCDCTDGGDYISEIYDDHITVRCTKCGKKAEIDTNSVIKAHDFLESDSLTLN
ncbi:MAG: hypothetical protein IJY41_02125 [Clostridia bacterium]|nr:hypothetical protein [Clostridia bacterium]